MKRIRTNKLSDGFTLIELIISLTIIALLVTVLYLAFSIASQLWTKQGATKDGAQRERSFNRLLMVDFQNICPFTFNWEKGKGFFFAGDSQNLFYVTTNGFGARHRENKGLFFCCLHLEKEQDGENLYLYKVPRPSPEIIKSWSAFMQAMTKGNTFVHGNLLENKGLLVIKGIKEAEFFFDNGEFWNPPKLDTIQNEKELIEFFKENYLTTWAKDSFPKRIIFMYRLSKKTRSLIIPVLSPPTREYKKP